MNFIDRLSLYSHIPLSVTLYYIFFISTSTEHTCRCILIFTVRFNTKTSTYLKVKLLIFCRTPLLHTSCFLVAERIASVSFYLNCFIK